MKKILSLAFLVLTALAIVIFIYFTAYREYEYRNCVIRAAKKLHISPEYSEIVQYTKYSISPGMTKEDVHSKLQEIGNIDIQRIDGYQGIAERITMVICNHPLNNFDLYVYYTFGGKLVAVRLEESP
jgi:hypothetical protein